MTKIKRPLIRHGPVKASGDIEHCRYCKDGRIVRTRKLIFCGLCGKEFRK